MIEPITEPQESPQESSQQSSQQATQQGTQARKNYETAIAELEHILTQLEDNQLPLEEAIKQFEAGVSLVKHCQHILTQTEQKIQGLMQNDNDALGGNENND
ncbi:exodeoxyribonuclease VII small subunit [Ostreibacterium oceani]|uniref:Exodeoxyribonuclease 7 small subunit n=1 Tax=Ostreibacterium oceani TaxID=2654998 RepID=A0A6N7EYV9_9GAMM|nr:exodeoxyribonuclease VII small subunit [Ostreibacterium oceani]MPV86735.1 exodeoxyribonuclease VII small subunit [Ostreibacterium oceani]